MDDTDIDMVVEVMGGTGIAKDAVLESLRKGKSVVTANSEFTQIIMIDDLLTHSNRYVFTVGIEALIAENLQEITSLVDEVNGDGKKSVTFAYEASVCGGIPIIHTLQSCYKGDIINEIMGICNGTTNYMLGKMEEVRTLLGPSFELPSKI